jgi:hypothetical protein
MSYSEATRWFAYAQLRGSLNTGRRIECGTALIVSTYVRSKGGKAQMSDFTPHEDQPAASIEDVAILLMGAVRANG